MRRHAKRSWRGLRGLLEVLTRSKGYKIVLIVAVLLVLLPVTCVIGYGIRAYCNVVMANFILIIVAALLVPLLPTLASILSPIAQRILLEKVPVVDLRSIESKSNIYYYYRQEVKREGVEGESHIQHQLIVENVAEKYPLIAKLLKVLDEEDVLTVKDVEEAISRHGIVLSIFAQERGVLKRHSLAVKERIANCIARMYGVEEDFGNIFSVFMKTKARDALKEYDPRSVKVPSRFTGISEFLLLLRKGVKSGKEFNEILYRLAYSYIAFARESLEMLMSLEDVCQDDELREAAEEMLASFNKLDPQEILMPPHGEEHPSIAVSVPFRYTLEILERILKHNSDEGLELLLDEVNEILRSRPISAGIKLHHLFKAVDCHHEGVMKSLVRVENEILKELGYKHILDLIESREDAAEALVKVIERKYASLASLLKEHCPASIDGLRELVKEIRSLLSRQ